MADASPNIVDGLLAAHFLQRVRVGVVKRLAIDEQACLVLVCQLITRHPQSDFNGVGEIVVDHILRLGDPLALGRQGHRAARPALGDETNAARNAGGIIDQVVRLVPGQIADLIMEMMVVGRPVDRLVIKHRNQILVAMIGLGNIGRNGDDLIEGRNRFATFADIGTGLARGDVHPCRWNRFPGSNQRGERAVILYMPIDDDGGGLRQRPEC